MPLTPVNDYTKFSTTVLGAQFAPAICALSGGGYVIVWQDDPSGKIYAQRFSASGQPVGAELHLDSTQGGGALWVSVAPTANDGFVIVFQAGSFAQAEIFGHRYDSANNPVGGLFAVNTTSPNEQYNPHVTALDNGSMLFTWDTRVTLGNDTVSQEVRGRIFDASGQPVGNDFAIAPVAATDQHGLSAITSLAGGGFVVTWQRASNSGTNFEIVGQRYNAGGGTVGAQFQVNTQSANSQYGQDVARLSDGGFVVSWVDPGTNNVGGRIVARHYGADGVAIGGEIVIDTKATGAYGRTVVTALGNGGYIVAWPDGENDTNVAHNVSARAFGSNDQPLDVAFDMSFDSPYAANFFSDGAITLANGNVVFAWDGPSVTPQGGQSTGQDVYMRQYSFSATGGPIVGGPGPDTLIGTPGDDVIQGLGNNDILVGQGGVDRMEGGAGNDTYYIDNVGDLAVELTGEGFDAVYTTVSYTLAAGTEVEWLSAYTNAGTAAINLTGNELAQYLVGNAGANILDGGGGADVLIGLGGNDTYYVDPTDLIVEAQNGGSDTVYVGVSYLLSSGIEVETLSTSNTAGTTAIGLIGNEFAQLLIGNTGNNSLDGLGGADTMRGLGGNDTYIVDNAGDVVEETAGNGFDAVYTPVSYALGAGQEIEWLSTSAQGGTGAINLTGNDLSNYVVGNNGANILNGGTGNDTLIGNGGADTFQFTTSLGATNVDVIADFVSGTDRIALDDAIFTQIGGLGALNANAFVTGTAAGDADDRIIYNSATGQLFYDADGNGAAAAVLFATLQGHPALAASDFTVI